MTEQKIIDDEGHFHAEDEAVDLSDTIAEGWISLAIFWLLGLTVFYQMNDSAAWTEEVARYMLIGVVFIGAAVGVAKNNQIQVDFFYRHMPRAMGRVLSMVVDVLRTAFFVAAVVMTIQMMMKIGNQTRMTIVDLPMNVVYALCVFGFAAMAWRSLQVLRLHWKRGYSVLERPESTLSDR
jgi:TRAP-type C4-dicarboxylate transport system permease small subunit